jgi:EAL domain-containing protein (putative c-di-GMP-specific phosphodiesterase class I)/uncharacterized caspase-like protein
MIDSSYHAILIGINDYNDSSLQPLKWAEKDCEDLYQALTDAKIGLFSTDNVVKLTGPQATLERIQENLYSQAVVNCSVDDTVVVYFSGHSFPLATSFESKVYLASYDSSKEQIRNNPYRGISLSQLNKDIFNKSPAKNVIFILDTCYSGSFTGNREKGSSDSVESSLETELKYYLSGTGRIAILSSPPEVPSREDDDLKNGLLTYYLVKGLSGRAADAIEPDGNVTIDSLMAYVRRYIEQPTGRYGQDYGRIILAKPGISDPDAVRKSYSVVWNNLGENVTAVLDTFQPLDSPLLPFDGLRNTLIDNLREYQPGLVDIDAFYLEAIRKASEANFALLIYSEQNDWYVKAHSQLENSTETVAQNIENTLAIALPALIRNKAISPEVSGISANLASFSPTLGNLLIIPVKVERNAEVLIISNPKIPNANSEVFAHIILGLYKASQGFKFIKDFLIIESLLLDNLKELYKFVPLSIYNRRFTLFTERLHDMKMRFQPIISLSLIEPYVCGFEALAYDPKLGKSPSDLFHATEIWGRKFMLELDKYFLRTALTNYRQILRNTPGRRRPEDVLELSVNVYPDSLIRTSYFEEAKKLISEEIIPNDKLFLEISEKMSFPHIDPTDGLAARTGAQDFRDILEIYVHDLGIGFAIDDFGVGYSSVSRLGELHPSYLKIDRDILKLNSAYDAVKFILSFVDDLTSKKYLKKAKVILEGFDDEINTRLKLGKLYDLGVKYIQGYIVGEPVPDSLLRIDQTLRDQLVALTKEK